MAVTGATGHLGLHVVRLLRERGDDVRALVLEDLERLDGAGAETIPGNVLDRGSLQRAFEGVEVVYHLAGLISIAGDPDGRVAQVNVEGVANAAAAALECGVRRFVLVGSIHAFALERGRGPVDEGSERVGPNHPAYDRSKNDGELQLRHSMERGLDTVVVNPTAFIGPVDHGPSLTGGVLLALFGGRLPALVGGGFDWVDVRDVAAGLLAAGARGRRGESYILSGHWRTVRELADLCAEVSGVSPPRFTAPLWLARAGLPFAPLLRRLGSAPVYTSESLRPLATTRRISSSKAAAELGFRARPTAETLADTYAWFRERGWLEPRG